MTNPGPNTPDPSRSAPLQGPPSAAKTNLPADASVWAAARRSFVVDGCSCPVVAERHGLHKRTVARHAHDEDWGAARAAHQASARRAAVLSAQEDALDDPAVAFVEDLHAERIADLLIHLSGDALIKNLAHLAAEAVAAKRPQETLAWLRAMREAERVAPRLDRALVGDHDPADIFRMEYFRGLQLHMEGDLHRQSERAPGRSDEGDPPAHA